ncbi:hypothetical protein ACS0TY_017124 [Phlomoides rotata]
MNSYFFLQIRTIIDGLLVVGQSISDEDLVLYILGGLGPKYDVVVVNLTTRGEFFTIDDIQFILQLHEMCLLQSVTFVLPSSSPVVSPSDLVANFASKYSSSRRFKGKPKFPRKNKLFCQICGKGNHIASVCFKRFDKIFMALSISLPLILFSKLLLPWCKHTMLTMLLKFFLFQAMVIIYIDFLLIMT